MLRELLIGLGFFILSIFLTAYSDPLNRFRSQLIQSIAQRAVTKAEKRKSIGALIATDVHMALDFYFVSLLGAIGGGTAIIMGTIYLTASLMPDLVHCWHGKIQSVRPLQ